MFLLKSLKKKVLLTFIQSCKEKIRFGKNQFALGFYLIRKVFYQYKQNQISL